MDKYEVRTMAVIGLFFVLMPVSNLAGYLAKLGSGASQLFIRELAAHERGFYWKNGHFAGNYQLKDKESTRVMELRWKLPARGQGIHPRNAIQPGITTVAHRC
jgi:hypothetical protein